MDVEEDMECIYNMNDKDDMAEDKMNDKSDDKNTTF